MPDSSDHDKQNNASVLSIILDGLASLDPVDWLDRRIGVWFHRPWRRLLARYGWAGLASELLRTAVGDGSWRFYVPREAEFSGWEIEQMLGRYGVHIWGRGFDAASIYFCVNKEQANWAEYLLKRWGVPVTTAPYNPLNDLYPQGHPPGSMPTPWESQKKKG